MSQPPLKPLHPLVKSKLDEFEKWTNQQLIDSLKPGLPHSLKARPDGTLLDGHHRIKTLQDRGVDVNALPREVIERSDP